MDALSRYFFYNFNKADDICNFHHIADYISFVTLRKHAYSNILKILPQKMKIFGIFFYILHIAAAHSGHLENRIQLKPVLGGVCGLANYIAVLE